MPAADACAGWAGESPVTQQSRARQGLPQAGKKSRKEHGTAVIVLCLAAS